MADAKITALAPILEADVQAAADVLPLADVSTSETKKVTVGAAVGAAVRVMAPGSLQGTLIAAGTVGTVQIADGAVTNVKVAAGLDGGKLAADSVTAREIAVNAITASELADGSVDTAAVVDAAITDAKIAGLNGAKLVAGSVGTVALADGAVTNAKITGPIDGTKLSVDSVTAAQIAPDAITSSELADGAVDTAAIADLAVSNSKLAAGIDGAKLVAGSIGATQIAANAISAAQLANGAVDTAAVQDGAIATVKIANAAVTTDKLADLSVTTAKLADNAVTGAKIAAGAVDDSKISGITPSKLGTASAGAVLAGPTTGTAAAAAFRALAGTDLPVATTTNNGAVKVAAAGGLAVAGDGALSIAASTTAGTNPVVTYGSDGRITAGRALAGTDLPVATTSAVGAVKVGSGLSVTADGTIAAAIAAANLPLATSTVVGAVKPGAGLSVDGAGALGITNAVAAGTGSVVTYNTQGLVTSARGLQTADLPEIDAAKITSGVLPVGRIGDGSIGRPQLADYALGFIQEASPPVTGVPASALWLQESTGQLRIFNSNSWFPVGFGRLSAENLRYCGIFDAATGAITGVTQFGTVEGFKIGDQVPSASDKLAGVYFVAATPGSGTVATPGVVYDAGDWILCNGAAAGWTRIDTLSSGGGGGGGGAQHLDDLLDVTLTAPVTDDLLQFTGAGQWVNVRAIDGGSY